MTMIWNRRRPSLAKRILGSLLIMSAAIGASVGAELLLRKLRLGSHGIDVIGTGRRSRVHVAIRRSPRLRRSRSASHARS